MDCDEVTVIDELVTDSCDPPYKTRKVFIKGMWRSKPTFKFITPGTSELYIPDIFNYFLQHISIVIRDQKLVVNVP